jgi:hypothetical protein
LDVYKKALKYGVGRFLKGQSIKPVFRRYNWKKILFLLGALG